MGLRCVCPQGHVLIVKPELVGKQGICPKCSTSFLIEEAPTAQEKQPSTPPASVEASPEVASPLASPAVSSVPEAVEWRLANLQGEQFGPTVPTLFAQWITQGRVPPDWLVWRTGWSEWRRADEVESELPAPLPKTNSSDTPPPVAVPSLAGTGPSSDAGSAPNPTKPSRSQSGPTQPVSPTNEYQLRRQKAVKRQRIIIGVLGVIALVLVGLLVWIGMKPPTV